MTIDTLRADHLPMYQYPRNTAPFLTSLAGKGIVFDNCFSASSHTTPSHGTLLTSLFPYQHGALRNGEGLNPGITTIAQVFKDMGYKTAAFSAVGFLKPVGRDFEIFVSKKDIERPDRFVGLRKDNKKVQERGKKAQRKKNRKYIPGSRVADRAARWVQTLKPDEKFFLWVHLFDVHQWKGKQKGLYSKEVDLVKKESSLSEHNLSQFFTTTQGINSDYLSKMGLNLMDAMNSYDGRIRYVDDQISRLFLAVEAAGFKENSLWIVTADHGEGLGNHNWHGHAKYLYREQLQVPLIFYFSDGSFAGRTVKHMVRLVDIFPTLLEVAGASPANGQVALEGRSFLPLVRDEDSKSPITYSFAQRRPADQGREVIWVGGQAYSLQSDKFKYILSTHAEDEFYDLSVDPGEVNNLINSPKKDAGSMRDRLVSEVERIRGQESDPAVKKDMEEHLEELRSLGYVQ